MSDIVIFDIEANALELKDITKIHCVGVRVNDGPITLAMSAAELQFTLRMFSDAYWCGHNVINYDFPVLEKVWGIPKPKNYYDTLLLSRLLMPERQQHSVEAWGQTLGDYKGDFKGPWDTFTEEMGEYCKQDVNVQSQITQRLLSHGHWNQETVELEHRVAELVYQQCQNGVGFNVAEAQAFAESLMIELAECHEKLQQLFPPRYEEMKMPQYWEANGVRYPTKGAAQQAGNRLKDITKGPPRVKTIAFNPDSRQQIVANLQAKYNWKPKVLTKAGNPVMDEAVLKQLPQDWPEVPLFIQHFTVNKMLAQVSTGDAAWLRLEKAGRIHGKINTLGARTRRMSHSKPNLAQIPSVDNKDNPYGLQCRTLFLPRDSWKMVGVDASGLEARLLGHYLSYYDGGEFTDLLLNGDIHSVNAETLGLPRYDAKTWFYAFLYGAQAKKLGSISNGGERKGAKDREKFYSRFPQIQRLVERCEEAHSSRGYIKTLDGSYILSVSSHSALNTLLQGAGALIMKKALVILDDYLQPYQGSFGYCLNVHDEWQIEADPKITETMGELGVKSIEAAGEHYNLKCPLTGEYKIGNNWAETH